jgi:hypothetical protein
MSLPSWTGTTQAGITAPREISVFNSLAVPGSFQPYGPLTPGLLGASDIGEFVDPLPPEHGSRAQLRLQVI